MRGVIKSKIRLSTFLDFYILRKYEGMSFIAII